MLLHDTPYDHLLTVVHKPIFKIIFYWKQIIQKQTR